jgi:hypothetical protein
MKNFKIDYKITDYFRNQDNYSASSIFENDSLYAESVQEIILEIQNLMSKHKFTSEDDRIAMGYGPECRSIWFGDILEYKIAYPFVLEDIEKDFPECYI